MLIKLFSIILKMSMTASVIILAVILMRWFLKKVPRVFSYGLWFVVLFRLLCPIAIESHLSMLPKNMPTLTGNITTIETNQIEELPVQKNTLNTMNTVPKAPIQPTFSLSIKKVSAFIWLVGIVVFLSYNLYAYIVLQRLIRQARQDKDNIYISENINTPFVMGIFEPKIYLPHGLSEREKKYIIGHEHIHIQRCDYILRVLALLALCLHWFNPLVWLAFILSDQDMEISCDEAVLKKMGVTIKKDYASLLLSLSVGQSKIKATPWILSFGQSDIKHRIKHILAYKKTPIWLWLVSGSVVIVTLIALFFNPIHKAQDLTGANYYVDNILYDSPIYSFRYSVKTAPLYSISSDYTLFIKEQGKPHWAMLDTLSKQEMSKTELIQSFKFQDTLTDETRDKIKKVKSIYKTAFDAKNSSGYLVMGLDDGTCLLAYGYIQNNTLSIRWLFELTKIEEALTLPVAQLWEYRTAYIGDNSAVINMINLLPFPSELDYDTIMLHTKKSPYGLTVNFKANGEIIKQMYTPSIKNTLDVNAAILFCLIENVEYIHFDVYDGVNEQPTTFQYTSEWENQMFKSNLWKNSESVDLFRYTLYQVVKTISKKTVPHIKDNE